MKHFKKIVIYVLVVAGAMIAAAPAVAEGICCGGWPW
jgi:hypothetical protein